MSAAIDTIECMFDSGSVAATARVETVAALRERIRGMERRGLRDAGGLAVRRIPTHRVLAGLLPGGGLRAGAVYAAGPSAALAAALLSEPSRSGLWTAVVGMPEWGVEAAEEAGVRLDRLVLVPRPGPQWASAVGVLAEVMGVILVRVPRGAAAGTVDRLTARLRGHGCVLVVTGPEAGRLGAEAAIEVEASRWSGIGRGHGILAERELALRVSGAGAARRGLLRVPEPEAEGGLGPAAPLPAPVRLPLREAVG